MNSLDNRFDLSSKGRPQPVYLLPGPGGTCRVTIALYRSGYVTETAIHHRWSADDLGQRRKAGTNSGEWERGRVTFTRVSPSAGRVARAS